MASYQIQQLASFCAEHRLESKVVLVPSVQAGTSLGTALARSGTNWINLRFCTPEDLAREISEPAFIADGWSPLPKEADLIELAPFVRDHLESPGNINFRKPGFTQGLLRSIHRTLRALRIAGIRPEALLRHHSNPKLRAIAQLFVAYQDCLDERRWYDGPDLFQAATTRLVQRPRPESRYAILDETPLPGLARRFVHVLTGDRLQRIGRSSYGVAIPKTVAAHGLRESPLILDLDCEPAGLVMRTDSPTTPIQNIELRLSTGPEVEVRSALARIRMAGWPLDSTEIVCASPDLLNYVYDATHKLDIPATFGSGVSILLTRPGQAIRAALNWIASGGDPCWLTALQDGRLLNVAPGKTQALPATLQEMATLTESSRSTSASYVAILGAQLLTGHVTTLTEAEEPARDSLVNRLKEIGKHCKAEGLASSIAETLKDVIEEHRFEAHAPKPGHLNVVPLDRAGFSGRPHVFVLGLDSGSFPGAPGEDPLLLDHERSRISGDLEMLRTRPMTQVWHLVRVLSLAPSASLSASRFRLADGQESEPAALFYHLQAASKAEPVVDGILPVSPEGAAEISTWMLSWARTRGNRDAIIPRVQWLCAGEEADRCRTKQPFTRFKGITQADRASHDDETIWSASRLETLSRCPYQYFWKYVLGIEPPEEDGVDQMTWLSPLDFGSLLHELFQTFMANQDDRDRPPSVDRGTEQILEMLRRLVDEAARRLPPPTPLAFEMDRARLDTAARVFVAEESKRPADHRPRGFEISFGFDASGGLNHPEPVSLQLGETTVRLRGLIDRVDRTDGGYIVWDYKTGSAFLYDESDLLGSGEHLQWALYAHVFSEIMTGEEPQRAILSGYYFASDREHGRKILAMPPTKKELGKLLRPVLGLAGKGAYPPIQKTSHCRFCDYKTICGHEGMLHRSISTDLDAGSDPELIGLVTEWLSN